MTAPRRWCTVAWLRRLALAASVLVLAVLLAVLPRTASPRSSLPLQFPEISLTRRTLAPTGPQGNGERSFADGSLYLGSFPARGALPLESLTPGQGIPGITLWPPAPLWPLLREGALHLEHGLLAPTTSYRLDLAWHDGTTQSITFDTLPLYEVIARGPEAGRIDPRTPVWARFGVDVDRASVEANFRLEPPAAGSFSWLDNRTVLFQPQQPLAYGVLHRAFVAGSALDGTPLSPTSWVFRPLIPPPLRVTPGQGAPVVFTFDDGTHDMQQAWSLLSLLRQYEVKAILFPTGRWARAHPDYIERALHDGHRLCNHSETHARLPRLTDEQIAQEILGGAGHGSCDLFRPPSMDLSKRVEKIAASLGYRIYLWDVDSRDWEGLYPEDITHRILARVKPHAVLLFHMHAWGTLEALPPLFARLRSEGYLLTYEGVRGLPKKPSEGPQE
ncbi:MAG: polysaccharide deacetylase family protein [Myxococcales bacterium]|nr:polysaccharide deacetylase family protein [Polyangiaceae bacterium]MDW8249291.1 polysaccharide deacetylase family protein [Myxococcales bacterium]